MRTIHSWSQDRVVPWYSTERGNTFSSKQVAYFTRTSVFTFLTGCTSLYFTHPQKQKTFCLIPTITTEARIVRKDVRSTLAWHDDDVIAVAWQQPGKEEPNACQSSFCKMNLVKSPAHQSSYCAMVRASDRRYGGRTFVFYLELWIRLSFFFTRSKILETKSLICFISCCRSTKQYTMIS